MESNNIKYHSTLARYFEKQDRYLAEEKTKPNTRKLVEQPWQQTKAELWDDVTETLCDLLFIEAKIMNSMTYELIDDYNTILKVLPEAQEEVRKEEKHQARIKKYTDDMIAYASKWNEARKKHREDPVKYPMPKDEDIPLPEIIQSVKPWSDEKRKKETERIINNPTRLDKVRAYSQFVISESSSFALYGAHPGFVIQQAYNYAGYPSILETAEEEVNKATKNILLLQKIRRRVYDPFPSLLNTLEGHTDVVDSVEITYDGNIGVSGSWDKTLRLWNLDSGVCLNILEGHLWEPTSVVITPDGKRIISGSRDHTLRLWDLESGASLKVLMGHTNIVESVAITPDGKRVVSGSQDNTIRLWDLENGNCIKVLEGHSSNVFSVAFTTDIKIVVSGSWDNTIRLWDIQTGKCLKVLNGHTIVNSVIVTPDGKKLISGSWDNTRLWNLENGTCLKVLEGRTNIVDSIAINKTNSDSVSEDLENTLRLWDLDSGACTSILKTNSGVRCLAYSRKFNLIISGEDNGQVHFFQPFNFHPNIQKITMQRLWLFGNLSEKGKWDKNITAVCQYCETRFIVQNKYISLIKDINKHYGITPDMSQCLSLPEEAFENPGLLSECPNCKKPIKFNPFIVDNRDN